MAMYYKVKRMLKRAINHWIFWLAGMEYSCDTLNQIRALQRKTKRLKKYGGYMRVSQRGGLFTEFTTDSGAAQYNHAIRQRHAQKVKRIMALELNSKNNRL